MSWPAWAIPPGIGAGKGLTLDTKLAIVALRGLIFLILGFFLLYTPEFETDLPWLPFALLGVYLASDLALLWLPAAAFAKPLVSSGIFLFDTLFISGVIYAASGFDSDLYLIYFLVIFMNGMQMRTGESFFIGSVASIVYFVLGVRQDGWELLRPDLLLRIPFFYIVSFFTAHFAQEAKNSAREKSELATLLSLHDASKAIFAQVEMSALLPLVAYIFRSKLSADDVAIMLPDASGKLAVDASIGLDDRERRRARLALGQHAASLFSAGREGPKVLGPLEREQPFAKNQLLREIRSSILLPLVRGGRLLGVISVNRSANRRPFAETDVRYAMILGAQTAQAVHNARLYQQLEEKISENKRVGHRLVQSEKMAAVGRLSAGLAHELRNPLSGVIANGQLLKRELDGKIDPKRLSLADEMIAAGRRCNEIITNLLGFSRQSHQNTKALALAPVVEKALELARERLEAKKIRVKSSGVEARVWAEGNQVQLEEVFLNLVSNAVDAMAEGGTLTLTAKIMDTKALYDFEVPAPRYLLKDHDHEWSLVEIRDDGIGISKEHMDKIFEPFFTTKAPGSGIGLGLAFCYEIVNQHGGLLWASSAGVDRGASFFVLLPMLKKPGEAG